MGSYEDTSWSDLRALTRERRAERKAVIARGDPVFTYDRMAPVRYSVGVDGVVSASVATTRRKYSGRCWVKHQWRKGVFRCAWCSRPMTKKIGPAQRTLDHVVPVSRGGKDGESNWVLACRRCNTAKADMWPEVFVREVLPRLLEEDRAALAGANKVVAGGSVRGYTHGHADVAAEEVGDVQAGRSDQDTGAEDRVGADGLGFGGDPSGDPGGPPQDVRLGESVT